jgi:preprotein translocase subunit SecE
LVERRSPKPEVGGSIPSAPAKKKENERMRNPLKFFQEVKQEAFKVTWPTGKETVQGTIMVAIMAIIASLFFLLIDQFYKFLLEIILKIGI